MESQRSGYKALQKRRRDLAKVERRVEAEDEIEELLMPREDARKFLGMDGGERGGAMWHRRIPESEQHDYLLKNDKDYRAVYDYWHNADGTPKDGYLKAPNGKKSNLPEVLWNIVRTPSFKKWFGDWESVDVQNFLNSVVVGNADINEFKGMSAPDVEEYMVKYFNDLGGMVTNPQIGKVRLTRNGVNDTMRKGMGRLKYAAFKAIPSIIEKGRIVRASENWKNRGYDTSVLAATIDISGTPYVAVVIVRQYQNGDQNFYLHEVSPLSAQKNKIAGLRSGQANDGNGVPSRDFGSMLSQPIFSVNPDSVFKVVDENGEPLVVAHRTMADFTEFKHRFAEDKTGRIAGLGLGRGKFYFVADKYENFAQFEDNQRVMRLFANVKNPISEREYTARLEKMFEEEPTANPENQYNGGKYDYEKRDQLIAELGKQIKEEGYDGIWDRGITGQLATFSPTQIKSADGITYDDAGNPIPMSERGNLENPDIRWRHAVTPAEDAAYADAVARGDRAAALRMIREAAARAMPNTKVLDKDGLPLVVYHYGLIGVDGLTEDDLHLGAESAFVPTKNQHFGTYRQAARRQFQLMSEDAWPIVYQTIDHLYLECR